MTGKARARRAQDLNQPPASMEEIEATLDLVDATTQVDPKITRYEAGEPTGYVDAFSAILRSYPTPVTTLQVEIIRAHDALFKGRIIEVPNDDHTAAMIQGGFYMVVPPTLLGVDWS